MNLRLPSVLLAAGALAFTAAAYGGDDSKNDSNSSSGSSSSDTADKEKPVA